MKWKNKWLLFSLLTMFVSCGEEQVAERTKSNKFETQEIHSSNQSTCANMTLIKPKVDILYVVDNSSSSFNISYTVKKEIAKTVSTVGSHFDYHIMVAPLLSPSWESNLTNFQVITASLNDLPNPTSLNIVSPDNLQFFDSVTGTNFEQGFLRVKNIINANRSNGVFRNNAYTLVVMISNGDDTDGTYINGQMVGSPLNDVKFTGYLNDFKKFTKKWVDQNGCPGDSTGGNGSEVGKSLVSPASSSCLQAEQFRFLTVVAHTQCKSGYKAGIRYKTMSEQVYAYDGTGNSSFSDTYDLCSGEYVELFSNINETIKKIILPHKYDHWKISNASQGAIEETDFEVKKVKEDGEMVTIPEDNTNGYEFLGYVTTPTNTRYEPTPGEPQTGYMIKLYGGARVTYPECIVTKTRTPTEWFGFVALPRKPDLNTVKIKINGKSIEKNSFNGWSSYSENHYVENLNIKVPGPTNASVTPALNKSGYFLKLNGRSVYTNGDQVDIYYKGEND